MEMNHSNFAVYKPPEASRLIGIPSQRIKRWIAGYSYKSGNVKREQPPLWKRRYSDNDECYLGFLDLIEIRFVNAFVNAGLSVSAVRLLLDKARSIIETDYPLSSQKFKTDGKTIFLESLGADEARTIDVKNGQHAFHSFIKPSFKDLEFDAEMVSKWYVDGKNRRVAIDPTIAFGQPVVDETGIPTSRILEAVLAEGNIQTVSRQFEISPTEVKHALEFEKRIASIS